jgi:hypothetical protein
LAALREHLCASPDAHKHDLIGLVDALSGLGCRIGELLALDWTKVDAEAGTLSIEGTVIRVPGEGLIVQPHTKSKAGMRTIHPPGWVLDLFQRRHVNALGEWIFPSTRLTLRDPDNTRARLRDVVRGTPWEGLHPHAFRHLVATRLEMSRVATDASFGSLCECPLLAPQRVRPSAEVGTRSGTNHRDLRCHHSGCTKRHDEAPSTVAQGDDMMHREQQKQALTRAGAATVRSAS